MSLTISGRGTFLISSGIKIVVLDEGDHMLDLGFKEELEAILDSLPNCQRVWLFSATMPAEIKNLANDILKPLSLFLLQKKEAHEDITHEVYLVPHGTRKKALLMYSCGKALTSYCFLSHQG